MPDCNANTANSPWVQYVNRPYSSATFVEWTWCVIENTLYMYHQGGAVVYSTQIDAAGYAKAPQ